MSDRLEDLRLKIEDRRRRDFCTVDHAVLDEYLPILRLEGTMIYLALTRLADDRGLALPSVRQLARYCGIGKSTVHARLLLMERMGLMHVHRGRQDTGGNAVNVYQLVDPPPLLTAMRTLFPGGPASDQELIEQVRAAFYPSGWEPLVGPHRGPGRPPLDRPAPAPARPRGRPRKKVEKPVPVDGQVSEDFRGQEKITENLSAPDTPVRGGQVSGDFSGGEKTPENLSAENRPPLLTFNPFTERIERSGNSAENAADFLPPSGTAGLAAGTRDLLSRERKNELLPLGEAAEDV
ncbi:MAG: helix-turn-helix domain-containing protein, partial [Candidatus Dormibacteria bacterium]